MNPDYQIANFKAFPDSGHLPLRPITLVYGPNSSGKSSIIQSLLLLKQTLDEAENPETLLLPKGNLVDLGNYREFVHKHELSSSFSFRLSVPVLPDSTSRIQKRRQAILHQLAITRLGVRIAFAHDQRTHNAVLSSLDVFVDEDREPLATYKPYGGGSAERVRRRTPPALRGTLGPGVALRGDKIYERHTLWTRLWDLLRSGFQAHSLPHIEKQLHDLRDRLEQLKEETSVDDKGEAQTARQQNRRARARESRKELEAEIAALEDVQNKFSRSLDEAVNDLRELHRRSFLSCKNFLPVVGGEIPTDSEESPERYLQDVWLSGTMFVHRHRLLPYATRGGATATQIALDACQRLREFLDTIVYLGPLREYPERHYIFSGNLTGQVGKTGSEVGDVLFKDRSLLRKVNQQLERFALGYELLVTGDRHTDVFSLVLQDRLTKVKANILDVGFGISQVLPVVVQSMLSRQKLLCIEQPEIHLHPRLQADLGSLLVECIRKPYENRFLIETHSQHLILRIQRLIREGELSNRDVSVLYVDRTSEGSRCLQLRLDEAGEFMDEWPNGFFEEGYAEIFG